MKVDDLPERIANKVRVNPESGCWEWIGCLGTKGYAQVHSTEEGKTRRAHRLVYELLVGSIPDGLHTDHLCRVRHCVNPEHLEPVTPAENAFRGKAPPILRMRETHCVHGHEFTPENTHLKDGRERVCRTCHRLRVRRLRSQGKTS